MSNENPKITDYFKNSGIENRFKTGVLGGHDQANITQTRPAAGGCRGEVKTTRGDGVGIDVRISVSLNLDRVETEDYGGIASGTDEE